MGEGRLWSNGIKKGIITYCGVMLVMSFIFLINIVSVSAKTVEKKEISPEAYTLTLHERDGIDEKIKGVDIDLKYSLETPKVFTYNDVLLKESINKLTCFDSSKVIESRDANLTYEKNSYVISKEVYGNKVNKDVLYQNVIKAIQSGETTINLQSINCYESPRFVEKSPSVYYAKESLNKYLASNITYNYAGLTQVLDSSIIKDWIGIDGNFQATINETKVRNYVDNLESNYNKALGTSIPVSGGDYGNNHSWIIDSSEETKALINNIKSGQTITKHPIYSQTAAASFFSNIGDTFVEIDMTKQHLWFYKDGYLVVEGDVVTGNVSNGNTTPTGIYKIYYKQKDTILKGEGYESPVSFWMPFNNGIGIHDASWRSEFGGEIYKNDGSHGCINSPYYVAKTVYDNINSGDTIICHN
jgi:lipoprotein-anchoring transpeptidase ErfK/SrfK